MSNPRSRAALLVALHLVVLGALAVWAVARWRSLQAEAAPPRMRTEPLTLTPLYDDPSVVSEDDLRRLLPRLVLRLRGPSTPLATVDHALRMWGSEARFEDPETMSGPAMLRVLLDHNTFVALYGGGRAPFLIDNERAPGVGTRVGAEAAAASHVDHPLATLAEIGTSPDQFIVTPRRRATVRELWRRSQANFSLNQAEYEWSALAYALYLPAQRSWVTAEGQRIDFDRLADRIMREPLGSGVCSSHHRMFALVAFLRVEEAVTAAGEPPLLSRRGRERVVRYLREVTDTLVRNQHPDGFWSFSWPREPAASAVPGDEPGDRLSDRIIATGHPLEWWALAPEELLPPRPVVRSAAAWLVRTADELDDPAVQENLTYLTHAGRALAAWRGRSPAAFLAASSP